jgi:hypothetical protein
MAEDRKDSLPPSPLTPPPMDLDEPQQVDATSESVSSGGGAIHPKSFYGGVKRKAPSSEEEEDQATVTTETVGLDATGQPTWV